MKHTGARIETKQMEIISHYAFPLSTSRQERTETEGYVIRSDLYHSYPSI